MASRLLVVLEQPWFDFSDNPKMASVSPFVEGLERSPLETEFDSVHLQFFDREGFKKALELVTDVSRRYKSVYLYIASHGSQKKVGSIQFDSFKEIVQTYAADLKQNDSRLVGILVGSCLFGSHDELGSILPATTIQWIAGYSIKTDWLESTMFEIKFLKEFVTRKRIVDTKDEAWDALSATIHLFNPLVRFGDDKNRESAFYDAIRCWVQGVGHGCKPVEIARHLHADVIGELAEELAQED